MQSLHAQEMKVLRRNAQYNLYYLNCTCDFYLLISVYGTYGFSIRSLERGTLPNNLTYCHDQAN